MSNKRVAVGYIWDGPDGRIEVSYQAAEGSMPPRVRLAIDLSDAGKDYLVAYMNRDQAVEVGKALLEAARRLEVGDE